DNLALVFGELQLSYRQLNQKANQLAVRIKDCDKESAPLIALYFDRSVEMVIAILAVLKAGAAYVPISPDYPQARCGYILKDSAATLILTQNQHGTRLDQWQRELNNQAKVLAVDAQQLVGIDNLSNSYNTAVSQDLAYVIYTSGTTGQPKGVMIEHHSVVNLVSHQQRVLDFAEDEVVLWLASYIFDASVESLFTTLTRGATLILHSDEDIKAVKPIQASIIADKVSHIDATPGYLAVLGQGLDKQNVRRVLAGGEAITADVRALWGELLVNVYGPTETTVTCVMNKDYFRKKSHLNTSLSCIGKGIDNSRVYVLSARQQLLPIGAPGELAIGGAVLARGYLNQPQLTEQQFIANPFTQDKGRLYRTGDRVRYLADGKLEFLGRIDAQVKIRGHRIELGEVEAALAQFAAINQAVVIDISGGDGANKSLAAYLVAEVGEVINKATLRSHLLTKLPDYMVPASFTLIDEIPLTLNGKLNRCALPAPELVSIEHYVAPRNTLEQKLCAIFAQVLGLEQVGIEDNFFDIGGNSLLVLKVIEQINQQLNLCYAIKRFYAAPTIRQLVTDPTAVKPLILSQEAILDEDIVPNGSALSADAENHILLTGATGFVGRYLLAELLANSAKDIKVFCLVRTKSADEGLLRIKTQMKAYGIWQDDFESRIEIVQGDLAGDRLGIDHQQYENLSSHIAHVYHCATYMDHIANYEQMKGVNVDGVAQVLRFVSHKRQKKLEYLSTTGVYNTVPGHKRNEQSSIDNEEHLRMNGYISTKWVGEKLILLANERGFDANIHRLGLVTGEQSSGKNDPSQWFNKLIISCINMGCCFSEELMTISLTPVDFVAKAIHRLATAPTRVHYVHLSHPDELQFIDLVKCYNDHTDKPLELVSLAEFLVRLQQCVKQGIAVPIEYQFNSQIQMSDEELQEMLAGLAEKRIDPFELGNEYTLKHLRQLDMDYPVVDAAWMLKYFGVNGG
ncbi:MAG: amino acid adenylation domain-containing protein/thioester reductase-like protein, partial [Phenylobacterium sp.]